MLTVLYLRLLSRWPWTSKRYKRRALAAARAEIIRLTLHGREANGLARKLADKLTAAVSARRLVEIENAVLSRRLQKAGRRAPNGRPKGGNSWTSP